MSFFSRLLLLPLGSYEYHGTELPPDTDTTIARSAAAALEERLANSFAGTTLLLPAVPFGIAMEHSGLPNTAFVSHIAYYTFIRDLFQSLAAPRDLIVVINGHGGNNTALSSLESEFNYSHADRKVFCPSLYPRPIQSYCVEIFGEFDAHAGSVEASLIAYYDKKELRQYEVRVPSFVRGAFRFFRTSEVTQDGVIKQSPVVFADPARGCKLHGAIVNTLHEAVIGITGELSTVMLSNE